jgi:Secretion system C-terminal sorting domain
VAFYHSVLSVANIQLNASPFGSGGTDVANPYLISYFSLDEGDGTELVDYGPAMSGIGTVFNAPFSIITYRQEATPNLFQPSQRVVNINQSSTAASGIDFVNQSTVTISGVVRFENTFCYQQEVEILVNGQSYFPQIFTDVNGRFVADFEPGVTVTLTPRYGDHRFSPGFFQVRRLNRPVAGVLFQNQTKREVVGQMAGGKCRLSVIPDGSIVKVKAQALNDCYYQELTLDNPEGKFTFTGLPPIPMAISVTQHSNNIIYDYFQLQGGQETDLRQIEKDTVDFIYTAPPNVLIQPFEENGCAGSGLKMIEQSAPANGNRKYKTDVRVYESYDGGDCFLDSFRLTINNQIAELPEYTIDSDTSTYTIEYWAGAPNIAGNYEKFLQVTAEVKGATATEVERVVVLGERSRESTFTTASPAMPLIILRDPPGDASSATLADGSTYCHAWSNAALTSTTTGVGLNLDLGARVVTYAGSPFGGVITETESVLNTDITASISTGFSYTNSAEVCITNDIEYSTSDGDAVLFGDADVYVGAAVNFEFSTTDVLGFDPDLCEFTLGNSVRVWPQGFGTKYVYSEWQIETDVIPSLELIGDTLSAKNWRRIVDYNKRLKERAAFRENITFDGLSSYTQTLTTSESVSEEFSTEIAFTAGLATAIGFEVLDIGATVSLSFEIGGGYQHTDNFTNETSRSVSFTLADDDPNDNFTVDVLDDPVFGTPVFRLKSGESMCPWEPGTLNREEVGFSIDRLRAINVPENDAAVFNVGMSNLGQTGNDPLVYLIGMVPNSNPDGAVLALSGAGDITSSPLDFQILPNQTINLQVAVAKGVEEYNYENIGLFMASACQWEHARGLGYNLAENYAENPSPTQGQYQTSQLNKFYKQYEIDVEFIEPCSPIDIGFPQQDWVVTPDDGNILFITLNEYIYDDPDLELVRVQYRRTGGDGSWINIAELPAVEFANSPVFKIVQWDMSELVDGGYEIRAVTQCFDVSLNPGISTVIKGRKETRPPQLFGTPQPGDGVLNPGDEISIMFSKRIRCDRIFPADGIGTNININSLALQDITEGGALVDVIITCNNDKIVIVPNIPNQFIENRTLRATVAGIEDLYGNAIPEPISWEFLVNRNNLYWEGGRIDEFVFEGSQLVVKRNIRNQGGSVTGFSLVDIPEWMEVFPLTGNVLPGDFAEITFRFPADIVGGLYNTTLQMITPQGPEPLPIDLRVACPDPAWVVNPQAYSYTMNMTVQLNIEGELSTDRLDLIGAFVGDELRGSAYVQYIRDLDRYLAFITVYSNQVSGETVTFRIWDASTCLLYGQAAESFVFETNDLIGSPLVPQVIHTNNLVRVAIPILWGWNWISYNVNLPDPSVNTALASLTAPQGATIKGQTSFSQYFNSGNLWAGSLSQLSHLTMYQYRSNGLDSIILLGSPVNLETTTIPIVQGWNWISYLPLQGMTVDSALQSLVPLNGDVVKSQTTFAQYVAGVGWLGNMSFMRPTQGYLLRLSNPGTLQYPPRRLWEDEVSFRSGADPELMSLSEHWTVNPTQYEHTMNVIALVRNGEGENILSSDTEVGAFMEGQVRGAAKPVYIEALDAWLLFLTVYSNEEGDMLSFRLYDESAGAEYALTGQQVFIANRIAGSIDQPVVLTLGDVTEVSEPGIAAGLRVFPNPARERVFVRFEAAQAEEVLVRVTDALGRQVAQLKHGAHAGENTLEWAPAGLARGLYTLSLHSSAGVQTVRVELQ